MADLIDRIALKRYLRGYRWEFVHREDMPKAIEMIDCAPAVDAVEVVRCIDCKYACLVTDHDLQCVYDEDSLLHPHSHYCSYGERRDGEE